MDIIIKGKEGGGRTVVYWYEVDVNINGKVYPVSITLEGYSIGNLEAESIDITYISWEAYPPECINNKDILEEYEDEIMRYVLEAHNKEE